MLDDPASSPPPARRRTGWVAALAAPRMLPWWWLALALHLVIYPEVSFLDGNMQNAVVALSAAWVEDGRPQIDGMELTTPDSAERDGHFYSGMAPGVSVLGVPAYAVARMFAPLDPQADVSPAQRWLEAKRTSATPSNFTIFRTGRYARLMVTNALLTIAFGFLGAGFGFLCVRAMARALGDRREAALLAGLTFVLGTVMLFYFTAYYTQSVALLLLLGALLLGVARPAGERGAPAGRLMLAGALAVGAGCCDYPYFLYAGLVLLGACCAEPGWRALGRRMGWLALGGAGPFALLLVYHHVCFGAPWATAYQFRTNAASFALERGVSGVAWPGWARLQALLTSPGEGLLTLSPVLALAAVGCWPLLARMRTAGGAPGYAISPLHRRTLHRRRVLLATLLALLAAATFHFCAVPWVSNMAAYGHRFYLAALPALAICAVPRATRGGLLAGVWRIVFFVLLAITFAITALHNLTPVDWWFVPGGPAVPEYVLLFPLSWRRELLPGLGLFAAWQVLPLVVLMLGAARARRAR